MDQKYLFSDSLKYQQTFSVSHNAYTKNVTSATPEMEAFSTFRENLAGTTNGYTYHYVLTHRAKYSHFFSFQ